MYMSAFKSNHPSASVVLKSNAKGVTRRPLSSSSTSSSIFEGASKIIKEAYEGVMPVICLHPTEDGRDYTDEELCALEERDFETRILINGTNCYGKTLFVSHHFTDNVELSGHYNFIRDYIKASHVTKQRTCAKSTLTSLLTMFFHLPRSDYNSFAITTASGLSGNGQNSYFEKDFAKESDDILRSKLCVYMHIVFNKMSIKKAIYDRKGKCNIFRVVHCETKYSKRKWPLVTAFFSFFLQICLTVYVVLKVANTPFDHYFKEYKTIPLASVTLLYSIMVSVDSATECLHASRLYKKAGPLQMMDLTVNMVVPIVLAVCGFLVILNESDFFDAVLNATALLFIPEIDDHLPILFGLKVSDIIENFLIAQSLTQFDKLIDMPDEKFAETEAKLRNKGCGVKFGDIYITNLPEEGATPASPFQPHQVKRSNEKGHQINPSPYVSRACLLQRVEWSYTTAYKCSSKPRVGYLKLTKVNGEVVEIQRPKDSNIGIEEKIHCLEGIYIITTYQMSEDVLRLRLCGSKCASDFLQAFDYYALWDMTSGARRRLSKIPDRRIHRSQGSKHLFSGDLKNMSMWSVEDL